MKNASIKWYQVSMSPGAAVTTLRCAPGRGVENLWLCSLPLVTASITTSLLCRHLGPTGNSARNHLVTMFHTSDLS